MPLQSASIRIHAKAGDARRQSSLSTSSSSSGGQLHRSTGGQGGDSGTTLMPMLRMRESTQGATS
jgi:hypothetical protein